MENQPHYNPEPLLVSEPRAHMAPPTLFAAIMARVDTLHEHATTTSPYTTLLDELANPAWEVRVGALHNLAHQHAHLPLETLASALHDEHPSVREAAVRLLAYQGGEVPLDYLVLALQDRDAAVRTMAIQVLEEQRTQSVAPLLAATLMPYDKQEKQNSGFNNTNHTRRADFIVNEVNTDLQQALSHTQWFKHAWLVFRSQFRLLRLNLLAGVICLLACYGFAFVTLRAHFSTLLLLLTWISLLFTGIGTIITNNEKQDHALELALSTPSSPRFILLCRWLFIIGPQIALALVMTYSIALFSHQSLGSMVQLWLAPMLAPLIFVSALALLLTLLLKSWLAYVLISFVPTVRLPDGHWLLLNTPPPLLMGLAVLCLIVIFYDYPRHLQRVLRDK